jgi:putative ribosome biogenesis GTPase RsgA
MNYSSHRYIKVNALCRNPQAPNKQQYFVCAGNPSMSGGNLDQFLRIHCANNVKNIIQKT